MTKDERLKIYEKFFHRINMYCITMNSEQIAKAIGIIDSWSYAHRQGNGELSDYEQNKLVEHAIKRMEKF